MRENIRLIFKNEEDASFKNIINSYQSLIFMAKDDFSEKNLNEIRNTILILLQKVANKNL